MSDHTVIAVLVGILVAFAAAIGYIHGQQKRRDAAYTRQLQRHERQLRAQDALIHAIAQDYGPEPGREREPGRPRRKLPRGWTLYEDPRRTK